MAWYLVKHKNNLTEFHDVTKEAVTKLVVRL
jgi:hypothetical protein